MNLGVVRLMRPVARYVLATGLIGKRPYELDRRGYKNVRCTYAALQVHRIFDEYTSGRVNLTYTRNIYNPFILLIK